MTRAQRTLVKSPPELWAEISDAPSLARRLSAFGEVRITRIEPETAVAWEGASVRGTVELEASGWGTKVTVTAEHAPLPDEQATIAFDSAIPADEPGTGADASDSPAAQGTDIPPQATVPAPREGFLARLRVWWHTGRWSTSAEPAAAPEPAIAPAVVSEPDPESEPGPSAIAPPEVEPDVSAPAAPDPELEGVLVGVLDDLGAAHHRPFSRS